MKSFDPQPERITLYFCKRCERQTISGSYMPSKCPHCKFTDFWSEFDDGAPCNRHGEEENDDEVFFDGEETFLMKKVA